MNDQVQEAFKEGKLKHDKDGKIEVVIDEDETELIRMSQFDDAQSKQAVEELTEKIESKKKGRQFDIEGINNAIMEEHTTVGGPNIADQFRQQEKNLKSK